MIASYFDFDHCLAYATAALLISVFVLLFYNLVCVYREYEVRAVSASQNARLGLVLQTGRLRLWIYEPKLRHYHYLTDSGDYSEDYNAVEFARLFDRDDFELLRSAVFDVCDHEKTTSSLPIRGCQQEDGSCHYYEVSVLVASRNAKRGVEKVLGIQRDVTDDYLKRQAANQLYMRYHTVFNSSLIDMIYYDKNGVVSDINEKACQSFGVEDRQQYLAMRRTLKDNPFFNAFDIEHLEKTYMSSMFDYDQQDFQPLNGLNQHGKVFYESVVNPIRNANGDMEGIYLAGRNITEMVQSYYRQQEGAIRLQKVNRNISDYVENINYALRVSDVRLVSYYPDSFTLEISTDVNRTQLRLSQLRCIRLGTPRFRRTISSLLNRMDHRSPRAVVGTVETEIRDKKGRQIWLMFNMVPMFDAEGRIERYFGMCRNLTDLVETEQQLATETKKAQETELLKESFLTNMSYEIRTPLNTVVGFAELFEADHDVADEKVFVEEIKRNSNTLLNLINDILFLSRLDAHMIEINKADVDFALFFESYCHLGWNKVNPNVKTIIENPFTHLVVHIDQENLGLVITRLCANAANYTKEGYLRAKCEYHFGELSIAIEDTGAGLDEESLSHAFDRFAHNKDEEMSSTGLDLPIVQELVHQMGGTVDFQSEKGMGTTIWVFIPCESKTIEKKRDVNV